MPRPAPRPTPSSRTRASTSRRRPAPFTGTAAIPFTITANDGGAFGVYDLKSAQALSARRSPACSSPDLVPVLQQRAARTVRHADVHARFGRPRAQTAIVYYSTNGTAWTTTRRQRPSLTSRATSPAPRAASSFASAPAGSSGVGKVTTPQLTLALSSSSRRAQAPETRARSATSRTPRSEATRRSSRAAPRRSHPSSSPGESGNADGQQLRLDRVGRGDERDAGHDRLRRGAGRRFQQVTTQAVSAATVYNGPAGSPQATGSFTGTTQSQQQPRLHRPQLRLRDGCRRGHGVGQQRHDAVHHPGGRHRRARTVQNAGNAADTLTLSLTAPTGFTATIYAATCPTGAPYTTFPTCTRGAQIGTGASARPSRHPSVASSRRHGRLRRRLHALDRGDELGPAVHARSRFR